MLTTPITNSHFHSRVLTLLSSSLASSSSATNIDITQSRNASPIVIPPLSPADTPLTPDGTTSQLIGTSSSWIDLCSPDPVITDISRQVLGLELSYAAFCGLTYVLIPGPRMRSLVDNESGLVQYARAVLDGLGQGPFMQLYIWLPMIDHSDNDKDGMGDLSAFARPESGSTEGVAKRLDLFGTWEHWDMIRTICNYSTRLYIGKEAVFLLHCTSFCVKNDR